MLQLIWRLTSVGGVPAVARMLLSQLDPGRFDAHALCVRPILPEDELEALGRHVTVHSMNYRGEHSRLARAALVGRMSSFVRAIDPDVIHTHSGSAWMSLPCAFTTPHASRVLDVHDAPFTGKHGVGTDSVEMMMIRRGGYHPVVHSTSVRADTTRALGAWRGELSLIPLGVQPRPRQPEAGVEFRRRFGIPETDKVILYTGHAPTKNVPMFVAVAREVQARFPQGVSFVLVGPPEECGRPNTDGVHRVPTQPSIVPALEAADVFLSTADYEGFGLAITEAMYTGVPVVSTAVGGVVDQVVDEVTGLLAPQGAGELLVQHTTSLLTDDDRRRRMGQAARRHVEAHFTGPRVVDDFERLYLRLASRPDQQMPAPRGVGPASGPRVVGDS